MAPQINALDLDALLERMAQGRTTQADADVLRDAFLLRVRMHVCAEALTTVLAHGDFIRKHFALDLRAEAGCALLADAIQEEEAQVDAAAGAILAQLGQAHSAEQTGGAPCG